jgi:4-hydroxy-tetrahydrodipicolinate synthase
LNGQFLIEEFDRGALQTMPESCEVSVRIWNRCQDGGRSLAREEFGRILPLQRYELQPGLGVSVIERNLFRRGIIACPRVRPPICTINAFALNEIKDLWNEAHAISSQRALA